MKIVENNYEFIMFDQKFVKKQQSFFQVVPAMGILSKKFVPGVAYLNKNLVAQGSLWGGGRCFFSISVPDRSQGLSNSKVSLGCNSNPSIEH